MPLERNILRRGGLRLRRALWNDGVSWVEVFEVEGEADETPEKRRLEERVWGVLKSDGFIDFVQTDDALGEIPWVVLDVCRQLAKKKRALAGSGPLRSSFKKIVFAKHGIWESDAR